MSIHTHTQRTAHSICEIKTKTQNTHFSSIFLSSSVSRSPASPLAVPSFCGDDASSISPLANLLALLVSTPAQVTHNCAIMCLSKHVSLCYGFHHVSSWLVGALSPFYHKGLHQGWKQMSNYLLLILHKSHESYMMLHPIPSKVMLKIILNRVGAPQSRSSA